jgi:uncharacterized protein (TIGR03000 family)
MFRRLFVIGGTATLAAAALLMTPDLSLAQRRGGGGREGGGPRAGGGREGGDNWQRGGYGGRGYGGYGYNGWGYPGYYGYNNWSPQYYAPGVESNSNYATPPEYYSNEPTPEYSGFDQVPTNRIYGNIMSGARTAADMNTARVEVRVPANAEVMFEDEKTTQTGSSRQFVSPPLTPGEKYVYDIQARWTENGRQVSRTRHIPIQAGQVVRVDFLRGEPSGEAIEGVTPPRGKISTDRGSLPGTSVISDSAVIPGTPRTRTTPGERGNLPGTTNPDNVVTPGTPRTRTTPGERGNLPGTPPPVDGTNPPPMPPK